MLCEDDVKAFVEEFNELDCNMGGHRRNTPDTEERRAMNARREQLEEWLEDGLEYYYTLYFRTREIPPQRRMLTDLMTKYMYIEYLRLIGRVVENP